MTAINPLTARFHARIQDIDANAWDSLRGDSNPFVSHAFLQALEDTGCIRQDYGWQPHHLGLYDNDRLVAAAPVYLKGNSHGEFVFDWSWASAWENAGGQYYPKLLNAVPYSPIPGPRLLAGNHPDTQALHHALTQALQAETDQLGLSSVHANFLINSEPEAFDGQWLSRVDIQFHWHNQDYRHFPDFLARLNHKKRKNIRQERRQVEASGLRVEWHSGDSLDTANWHRIHQLYESTFDAKGNHPALTDAFFHQLASMGQTAQIALARDAQNIVAMALFIRSDDTLYGRYWGAIDTSTDSDKNSVDQPADGQADISTALSFLHFELCYYQGIEYCIREGLQRFEPGAQGQRHKMARGFLPTLTHSRHYIAHEGFRKAVGEALRREREDIHAHLSDLQAHSPYAQDPDIERKAPELVHSDALKKT